MEHYILRLLPRIYQPSLLCLVFLVVDPTLYLMEEGTRGKELKFWKWVQGPSDIFFYFKKGVLAAETDDEVQIKTF